MEDPWVPWKPGFVSPLWLSHSSTIQTTEKAVGCFLQKTSQTPEEREQLQGCREIATACVGGCMSWLLRCQRLNSWLISEELFPLLNIKVWDKTVSRGSDCSVVLLRTKYTYEVFIWFCLSTCQLSLRVMLSLVVVSSYLPSRTAMKADQHKIINLLETPWDFIFAIP